jgi:hypothetical protein
MAYAYGGGAAARPPSKPTKDRVLQFPKEKRRASLYARASAKLH